MIGRHGRTRAALIMAAGVAALLAQTLHLPTPVRAPLIFAFVLACPGLAWVGLLRLREPLAEFVLGVALSLVAATLASEALALLRLWSASAILLSLVIAAFLPCVHALLRRPVAVEPA
jgi:hypothetical protein